LKILVTAGNTAVPIDQVREITNVFTGRTGATIAAEAYRRGHVVTLLTSHPDTAQTVVTGPVVEGRWSVVPYHTFDDLMTAMESAVRETEPDAIVHSAAVSDFQVAGVYAPAPDTRAVAADEGLAWEGSGGAPRLVSAAAGKVKSDAPELWLRLTPTPKIVDLIRAEWKYRGILVKFKLEVGVDEARLLEIAEASRRHSGADLMVANARETVREWAYIGPTPDGYRRVPRAELPAALLSAIEEKHPWQSSSSA
jgi:phosphopantothenate-cysteine ligase/phosphopantothenoylcysteine decarboxylase/phosphopantothenate--cysteine ligase